MKKTAAGRRTARRVKAALWSALLAACLAGRAAPAEAWDSGGLARAQDGSYAPSGTLVGVEVIQNPGPATAVTGDGEPPAEERKAIAESYAPFGVTYDAGEDQWYYNGEAVCFLRDVLISNGESLTGGGFHGVMRTLNSERGTVRVEAVRDFARPDSLGYGTLTGFRLLENE